MGRFFITPREINFINDVAKELVKDVIGQKIYYYPISETKSKVHDVYEESPDKVFENPIEIDCLVKYQPQEIRTNRFGSEEYYTIDPKKVEEAITQKTKAIIAVHLYGQPVNPDIFEIGKKNNIPVIEDAAQGHGGKLDGKMRLSLPIGNNFDNIKNNQKKEQPK